MVNCRCDNMAVVAVINSRTSRDPDLMHQLRCLAFFEAKFSFSVKASHIAGAKNSLADDLSRNRLSSFIQAVGHFDPAGKYIPPQALVDMLCNAKPDWTSQTWKRMFRNILNRG